MTEYYQINQANQRRLERFENTYKDHIQLSKFSNLKQAENLREFSPHLYTLVGDS